jgi:UDP-N-acetyl-D-mannosaminuronic acid transferase (WecB/TagA/CpsF family)
MTGAGQMRRALLLWAACLLPMRCQEISGNDILVMLYGSQGDADEQQAIQGIDQGVLKSANTRLKEQINNIKFLFLEMGHGGLFDEAEAQEHVAPFIQRHLEKLKPKVILSMGQASSFMDNLVSSMPAETRPNWHLQCMQDECS